MFLTSSFSRLSSTLCLSISSLQKTNLINDGSIIRLTLLDQFLFFRSFFFLPLDLKPGGFIGPRGASYEISSLPDFSIPVPLYLFLIKRSFPIKSYFTISIIRFPIDISVCHWKIHFVHSSFIWLYIPIKILLKVD